MDNSWDYNDGQSEIRMGKALRDGYREKAFLMTKIHGRTRRKPPVKSTSRCGYILTDVDLLQHHEIIRYEEWTASSPRAALWKRSMTRRRRGNCATSGLRDIRTWTSTEVRRRSRGARISFDTVQMPLNVMDAHFRSFEKLVLPELVDENIGVLQ